MTASLMRNTAIAVIAAAPLMMQRTRQSDAQAIAALQQRVEALARSSLPPIGAVIAYAGALGPSEQDGTWLPCDGRPLSSTQYSELFKALGPIYGDGRLPDGSKDPNSNFNLPDYSGAFLRGYDPDKRLDTRAEDRLPARRIGTQSFGVSGNAVGSFQFDALQVHGHTERSGGHTHGGTTADAGDHTHPANNVSGLFIVNEHPGNWFANGSNGEPVRLEPQTLSNITLATRGNHHHEFTTAANTALVVIGTADDSAQSAPGNAVRSGGETRPANFAVKWLIRAR